LSSFYRFFVVCLQPPPSDFGFPLPTIWLSQRLPGKSHSRTLSCAMIPRPPQLSPSTFHHSGFTGAIHMGKSPLFPPFPPPSPSNTRNAIPLLGPQTPSTTSPPRPSPLPGFQWFSPLKRPQVPHEGTPTTLVIDLTP